MIGKMKDKDLASIPASTPVSNESMATAEAICKFFGNKLSINRRMPDRPSLPAVLVDLVDTGTGRLHVRVLHYPANPWITLVSDRMLDNVTRSMLVLSARQDHHNTQEARILGTVSDPRRGWRKDDPVNLFLAKFYPADIDQWSTAIEPLRF